MTRRTAAGLMMGWAAARAALKPGLRFREVAASLYAWDLADEGTETVLSTLRESASVNSVYLVALMHHEKRPLTDLYFPHNPKRKTYLPEDSRAYWLPNTSRYAGSKIKPLATEFPDFRGKDWLAELVAAAKRSKLKVGAEISHTVLDKERARGAHRDVIQQDIFGNRIGQLICHNHPDARAYVLALFTDLAANYELDYVQTCMLPFAPARPPVRLGMARTANTFEFGFWGLPPEELGAAFRATTLGGCFCAHCHAAAKQDGFDLPAMRKAMLPVAESQDHPDLPQAHRQRLLDNSSTSPVVTLIEHPEILDLIRFRCRSMTRAYGSIQSAMKAVRPGIDFRDNSHIRRYWEFAGLDYRELRTCVGSVRSSDYSEQQGRMESMQGKRRFLLSLRAALGDDVYLLSAIGVRPKATPELIRRGVAISAECGADAITLGHYDGAPMKNLEAVGQALRENGIAVG